MNSNIPKLAKQLKESPQDSFLKFALALELLKTGDTTKALSLFRNILSSDPNYVGVYYHLGKLYEETGENKLALKCYKDGIRVSTKLNEQHAKSELQSALLNLEMEIEDTL